MFHVVIFDNIQDVKILRRWYIGFLVYADSANEHATKPENKLEVCGALWLSGSVRDIQARDRGFDPRLRCICSTLCSYRQGTLLTRALSRPRSKWVPSRTVKACVRIVNSLRRNGSWAVCSPGSWDGLWTNRSCDLGIMYKVGRMALRARYQTINLHLYLLDNFKALE